MAAAGYIARLPPATLGLAQVRGALTALQHTNKNGLAQLSGGLGSHEAREAAADFLLCAGAALWLAVVLQSARPRLLCKIWSRGRRVRKLGGAAKFLFGCCKAGDLAALQVLVRPCARVFLLCSAYDRPRRATGACRVCPVISACH